MLIFNHTHLTFTHMYTPTQICGVCAHGRRLTKLSATMLMCDGDLKVAQLDPANTHLSNLLLHMTT